MTLRGFDSYEVSLGDEMRGERASLGKSLADAEKDMRIKSRIIEAIEDCDLSGFPNQSVIAGYVRSYARYLGMDPEICFARFCEASGYVSPSALRQQGQAAARSAATTGSELGLDPIGRSRFAPAPVSTGFRPSISLGAIGSMLALVGLIGGLGYGGYALLQDIQRVGFAPLPEAPAVVADVPMIESPSVDTAPVSRPAADDYAGGGVLTAIVMPAGLAGPGQPMRDGPISAIDPTESGVISVVPEAPPIDAPLTSGPGVQDVGEVEAAETTPLLEGQTGVALIAAEEAWVRIRDGGGNVLYEGILGAGERYDVPERLPEPVLRAGNAGGIFLFVDGVAYGPVGERGRVVSGISLRATDIQNLMPQAEPEVVQPAGIQPPEQRAEASQVPPRR